ncbi:hypothetical protein OSB04_013802 [Centaurea solstitialis]|uniref:S-adenosylmethionine synthetase central domain-containing protein n=1 Tax=Centaurea solstitialis TaxID=347529 RepID=A0AA38TLH4_9ASTR|nr:hypothetical protein OSB04_013802 [Centaurea solstitialis]
MFGYAIDETSELLPLTHILTTKIGPKLTEVQKNKTCLWILATRRPPQSNVGDLLPDVGIEADIGRCEPDAFASLANDLLVVYYGLAGNLAEDHDHVGRCTDLEATLLSGSCFKHALRMASKTLSQSLCRVCGEILPSFNKLSNKFPKLSFTNAPKQLSIFDTHPLSTSIETANGWTRCSVPVRRGCTIVSGYTPNFR